MGVCTNERWEINLHLRATTASLNERQNAEITLTHGASGRVSALGGHSNSRPIHPSPRGKNCCTFCQTNELNKRCHITPQLHVYANESLRHGWIWNENDWINRHINNRSPKTNMLHSPYEERILVFFPTHRCACTVSQTVTR